MHRESSESRAFYFGTYERPGHYLRDGDWRNIPPTRTAGSVVAWGPLPWRQIDGPLYDDEQEGRAALHHKDGWTALGFANRTDDKRPGSNSAFFFEGILTFDEAITAARERFPHVIERLPFEIVEATHAAAE